MKLAQRPALAAVAVTELRLHLRHGLVAATAALTAMWVAIVVALPAPWRPTAVGWVLFVELAVLGFFFVPALAVIERGNGVTAALRLTRLSPASALAVRVAMLAATALTVAVVVLVAAGVGPAPTILAGVVLTSALTSLLATVMVGRSSTLAAFITRTPAVGVPLMLPALLHGTGVVNSAWTAVSPLTGALDLLMGRWSWLAAAWILAWISGLAFAAARFGFDTAPTSTTQAPAGRRAERWPVAPVGYRRASAVRSLARADRRMVATDGVLIMLIVGVPALAVALRWLGTAGLSWAQQSHGVDLAKHLPLAWALVLVVHVPVIIGTCVGLLFVEDRDAGLLPALATTRASLSTLLVYRLGAAGLAAAALVALAVPVAGAYHHAGGLGLVITALGAGVVGALVAFGLAAFARDRAQAMALVKAAGLPLYLPLAWWFVDAPIGWVFAVVPTAWTVRAFWAESVTATIAFAVGGVAYCLLLGAALHRRIRRQVAT